MPGSIGLDDGSTTANITTDENGNVTITISPKKPDGTPNTAIPPSKQYKGKGRVYGTPPGPGEKSGTFEVPVGDPLYVRIECKLSCEVVISVYTNPDDLGTAVRTWTFPDNEPALKLELVALLKQAAKDAQPKPAAAAPPKEVPPVQKGPPPKK
jgi:hypothetical protein